MQSNSPSNYRGQLQVLAVALVVLCVSGCRTTSPVVEYNWDIDPQFDIERASVLAFDHLKEHNVNIESIREVLLNRIDDHWVFTFRRKSRQYRTIPSFVAVYDDGRIVGFALQEFKWAPPEKADEMEGEKLD